MTTATATPTLTMTVLGDPVPKARPRVTRPKRGKRPHAYTPDSTVAQMDRIRQAYIAIYGSGCLFTPDQALAAQFIFILPRPRSIPKRRYWPTTRPDNTNYAQLVADALTGFAYPDDSQLVSIFLHKEYAKPADHPRTIIRIAVLYPPNERSANHD